MCFPTTFTLRQRFVFLHKLLVWGDPPPRPHEDWASLAKKVRWPRHNERVQQLKLDHQLRTFNAEVQLLDWAFKKLLGLQMVVGLIFAVAGAIVPAIIALILSIWALAARLKVFRKVRDAGEEALMVQNNAQVAWAMYKWTWSRVWTRIAIECMFWLVSAVAAATFAAILIVKWQETIDKIAKLF